MSLLNKDEAISQIEMFNNPEQVDTISNISIIRRQFSGLSPIGVDESVPFSDKRAIVEL